MNRVPKLYLYLFNLVPEKRFELSCNLMRRIFLLHILMYSYAMECIHIVVWTMSLPWQFLALGRWYIVSTHLSDITLNLARRFHQTLRRFSHLHLYGFPYKAPLCQA